MTQPTHLDLDVLDKLIDAADGWKWETVQGDQFGHLSEGEFYDIGTVDADQYAVGEESHNEAVLNFIAAFNPQTCRALLDRLRKAEAARERYFLAPLAWSNREGTRFCGNGDKWKHQDLTIPLYATPTSAPTAAGQQQEKGAIPYDIVLRELHLLEEVCAFYANDEDRHLKDEGEPYGSIPTEVGMKARSARKRFIERERAAISKSTPTDSADSEGAKG